MSNPHRQTPSPGQIAALLGVVFIVGRGVYARRYVQEPSTRSLGVMLSLPFEVDLWKVQYLYFRFLSQSAAGQESVLALGQQLSIRPPHR